MHAAIQGFNLESILEYSDRVYEYCIKNLDFTNTSKSWLISCVSHAMHRFSRGNTFIEFSVNLSNLLTFI